MNLEEDAINLHRMLRGKIEIHNRVSIDSSSEGKSGTLDLIYTPGVASVARKISTDKRLVYDFTSKWNNVAIVCDGTRVLGLGNIGPEGAIPVMEGKSVLFKALGGINAFPICIDTRDKEEIIKLVKAIQPVFGAVNIEDIESPKVLEIVERLHKDLSIPVFHDDQHGTAIIALAGLLNALRLLQKRIEEVRVVIAGAGSAGYGIFRILNEAGCKNIVVTDSSGAIYEGRFGTTKNPYKKEIASKTNSNKLRTMNQDAIVFALSNPDPEIVPSDALRAGAKIVATGRSDFANQINNAVVFPSILRALLDLRVKTITEDMLVSVAKAIADIVDRDHLKYDYIIPKVDDPRIIHIVTETLKKAIQIHIAKKVQ